MSPSAPEGGSNIPGGAVPGRPRNTGKALIATGFVFMALLGLFDSWITSTETGLVPLLLGVALATLPVPIYVALVLWIDRYEKEPIWMLGWAFFWGAGVAGLFSTIFNTVNQFIVAEAYGEEAGEVFGSVISAPVVEESSKGLALLILFLWKKDEFDGVLDGIVYAGMVGLGFAMTENFVYYGRAIAESVASDSVEIGVVTSLETFVFRGVISPFVHPVFTSVTGIGFGVARWSNNTLVKFLAPVVGLLGAMALHSLWNGLVIVLSESTFDVFVLTLLLLWPAIGGILLVVFFELRRERRLLRRYLRPELQSGLISQREYDTLSSLLGRLDSSFDVLSRDGFKEWRAHSRFKQAAAELAFYRDRVARGVASEYAGREAAYVASLHHAPRLTVSSEENGMRVSPLIRWGALSAVLGGVLWALTELWMLLEDGLLVSSEQPLSEGAATGSYVVTSGLYLLGAVLVLFGLVSLYLYQSEEAGVPGGLGFVVAFLGTALVVGFSWSDLFVVPSVAVAAPDALDTGLVSSTLYVGSLFSFLVLGVGWALFGVGALLARRWPRWVAILLIIGALLQPPVMISPINGGGLVLDVAVALMGYFTLVGGRRPAEQPSRLG